tara:strand:- start:492 stop:1334 length:843 start_codon:yes stop_codon:yes gene_type:complete
MGEPNLDTESKQDLVKCNACAELILKEANKCKHCGELQGAKNEYKGVGFMLGSGIFLMPYIFGWFTLRKGYSPKSRVITFLWMGFVAFSIFNSNDKVKNNAVTKTNTPVQANSTGKTSTKKAAPVNPMGMWAVRYYVDSFGDKTSSGYITHDKIRGTFSNTATQNSRLDATFLMNSYTDIDLKLFEYARSNPVKTYGETNYIANVKDSGGGKHKLRARNYKSDRMSFDEPSSKKLHSILKKGGTVKFSIHEANNSVNQYNFVIDNAGGYYNAYKKLHKIK